MKKYRFTYCGTLEQFDHKVALVQSEGCDGFILEKKDGKYSFGLARGGHSGGYWYRPEYSEEDGILHIEGRIRFESALTTSKFEDIALTVILSPIILIVHTIRGAIWVIKKILGKPITADNVKTALFRLMLDVLGCLTDQ